MPLLITSGNLALTGLRLSWTLLLNIVRSLTVGLECVVLIFIADQFLNINVQVRTCDGLLAPYRILLRHSHWSCRARTEISYGERASMK